MEKVLAAIAPRELLDQAAGLERKAHALRGDGKVEEAFTAFDRAAGLYRDAAEHFKAAVCYASAATCWNIRTGWQSLANAATRTERAAEQAAKAAHFDYARRLYADAASLYEQEGDGAKFSACFYASKQADGHLAWHLFVSGQREEEALSVTDVGWTERLSAFGRWLINTANRLVWGYGERPARTFGTAFCLIFICALAYRFSGGVLARGVVRPVSFLESLYMSIITFTTVGFGDYLPLGGSRIFASLEALSGILLAPLFLVALTRRYLRTYR